VGWVPQQSPFFVVQCDVVWWFSQKTPQMQDCQPPRELCQKGNEGTRRLHQDLLMSNGHCMWMQLKAEWN